MLYLIGQVNTMHDMCACASSGNNNSLLPALSDVKLDVLDYGMGSTVVIPDDCLL